jgi:iron complex outermembrane receptor protein
VKKLFLIGFLLNGLFSANAQLRTIAAIIENPSYIYEADGGSIEGKIVTTDNQPAAFVTVGLKEINRFTITDDKGNFIIKNIKQGTYTLQVSMTGLQPQ